MGRAEDYDDLVNYASLPPETEAEVAGLARLGRGGRVLELGVGTGRVAIPLARGGLEVHGIELDPVMAQQLRKKTGGELVRLHLGDMADVDVEGSFDLVYAVFGTFFALLTQDAQVRCFRNVAAHLTAGGRFLIEALVPQPGTYTDRRKTMLAVANDERVVITISELDPLAQTIDTRQVLLEHNKARIVPIHIRYSWAQRTRPHGGAGRIASSGGPTGNRTPSPTSTPDTSLSTATTITSRPAGASAHVER